ncbi:hypothetical protein [Streptomyces sp. NPDC058632]|uniref:hypothetical protein n=1 Tax=unclassified Streptomyces TaxID=2593676 RepID=UPI00365AFD6A
MSVCSTSDGGENCSAVDIGDLEVAALSRSGGYVLAYSYNGHIEVFGSDGGSAFFRKGGRVRGTPRAG